MKLIEAQMRLAALKLPVIQTSDASACLKITRPHASKILERLAKAGIVVPITRGLWAFAEKTDPLILPELLTAPFPSYVSLQTALFYHGMISQIPDVIYAVSLSRTRTIHTPIGVFSIHHINSDFFFGFEFMGSSDIKMAIPEKALLDTLYLTPARSLLFKALPELEIPETFDAEKAFSMILKIPSPRLQTLVKKKLEKILSS